MLGTKELLENNAKPEISKLLNINEFLGICGLQDIDKLKDINEILDINEQMDNDENKRHTTSCILMVSLINELNETGLPLSSSGSSLCEHVARRISSATRVQTLKWLRRRSRGNEGLLEAPVH